MRALAPQGDDWAHAPTPFRKALTWFRHYSSRFVIGCSTAIVVTLLISHLHVDDKPWWLLVIAFACIALWFVALFESDRHALRWCERCIWKRVTENGREAAEKDLWQLRVFHARHDHPIAALFVTLVLAIGMCLTDGMLGFTLFTLFLVSTSGSALIDSVHAWHQPWCRLCGNGGDDDVEALTPDPVGRVTE